MDIYMYMYNYCNIYIYILSHPRFILTKPNLTNKLPSGKLSYNELEHHHFQWENPLFLWLFPIAFCMFPYRVGADPVSEDPPRNTNLPSRGPGRTGPGLGKG